MLDEYCRTISDEAQLEIALHLSRAALPIWTEHFAKHPGDLENLNSLIVDETKVRGGTGHIDIDFLSRALQKIERSYEEARGTGKKAVPVMKADPLLEPMLATSMQPLTNPQWDDTLPRSVRLVFTSVWNILTWILFKRLNHEDEPHIYIAINQAADALMEENLMTVGQINKVLTEYKDEKRKENEDAAWESAGTARDGGNREMSITDVYRKIAGENIVNDPPGEVQVAEILRQMREEDRSYWNEWEEYLHGTCKTYSYNKEKKTYWRSEADVIVGSFFNEYAMSGKEMAAFVSGTSLNDLRKSGFEI